MAIAKAKYCAQNQFNNELKLFKEILCYTIGSEIEILDSTNKNQIGINGLIVFETKNSIEVLIFKDNKQISLIKSTLKKIKINELVINFDNFFTGFC